jgi:hypothetical protein
MDPRDFCAKPEPEGTAFATLEGLVGWKLACKELEKHACPMGQAGNAEAEAMGSGPGGHPGEHVGHAAAQGLGDAHTSLPVGNGLLAAAEAPTINTDMTEVPEGGEEGDGVDPFDDLENLLEGNAEKELGRGAEEGTQTMGDVEPGSHCNALGTGGCGVNGSVGLVDDTNILPDSQAMDAAPSVRVSPRDAAYTEVRAVFGNSFEEEVHRSHALSFAEPLLYCRRCGAHCSTPQYMVGLKQRCEPTDHRTKAVLSKLDNGLHPTTRASLAQAVPLHPLTAEEARNWQQSKRRRRKR